MGVGDVDVGVDDVAGVGGVVEDAADGHAGPFLSGPVGDATPVEFLGDSAGTDPLVYVEPDDFPEDGRFAGVDDEFLCGAVDGVSVGAGAADPPAFPGFGVHAAGDAVDDGFAFEFGEDAEELHEHPPDSGRGIERFGGRGERDAGFIEFGEQVEQV
ncbi:MAG TPA: hypothetical protein VMU51_29410 [Mycobacteriales bacterium]|nr:hypothetical protein [Mycobacteriales bacterium]